MLTGDLDAFETQWTSFVKETDRALSDAEGVSKQFASMHEALALLQRIGTESESQREPGPADACSFATLEKVQALNSETSALREENTRLKMEMRAVRLECMESIQSAEERSARGIPIEEFQQLTAKTDAEKAVLREALDAVRMELARTEAEREAERRRAADEIFSIKMEYDAKLQRALRGGSISSSGGSSGAPGNTGTSSHGAVSVAAAAASSDREIFRKKTQLMHAQYQEQIAALNRQIQALQRKGGRL